MCKAKISDEKLDNIKNKKIQKTDHIEEVIERLKDTI